MELGLLFAIRTTLDFEDILKSGEEDNAYFFLYNTLCDEAKNGDNGIRGCDKFLKYSMIGGGEMSNDFIVHVLNVLSSIKEKLHNWDDFVLFSSGILESRVGKEKAKELLKVIG